MGTTSEVGIYKNTLLLKKKNKKINVSISRNLKKKKKKKKKNNKYLKINMLDGIIHHRNTQDHK